MSEATQQIPFTQYKLPDGRRVEIQIERPTAVAEKAQRIIAAGYVFECEVLRNGEVSFTITDPEEGDLAFQVCANGSAVPAAVDRLIERFKVKP